ncbi:MAG: phage tail tape measure protein [Muribaculaceae bacterium]|nr:phage tail tape measure protein [Muribaculaceae bacterium]
MANYSTTAQIILSVNGKQAASMMTQMTQKAEALRKKLAAAQNEKIVDSKKVKRIQSELNQTERVISQLQNRTAGAEQVLRRLDKASPKELNRSLKQLQQQLNGIQRGSAAWNAQIAKIKAVKAELQRVNATMQTQQSMWARMNNAFNTMQASIMAVVAALGSLVMAGRKAVNTYAEMEEAIWNTVKYTRMSRDQVDDLNNIFKGIDTRLGREQLNLLAQEGGRLGFNTIESVKQYVEAAQIINVALCDLGEGATQTIAKISNIFGMQQAYGVKDAMLKIGSTVNHLSQNCTAAKPFIVEFAQRMAGIGSTAKMTIPEIMAFAATLDAHGQKVEMSATALQRVIMNLFKAPGEMAKKVGLESNQFIETLNKSVTDGVMMFLEQLNKLGEDKALAILSPLFKDLGFDGARVAGVLANLSSHLDFLKWQMGEAAEAFRKGTSATNEFNIFNNTAKANIEKARYTMHELAVELGEQLYPVMKHVYTSGSLMMRTLKVIVNFFVQNWEVIKLAAGSLLVYNGLLLIYNTRAKLAAFVTSMWNMALAAGRAILPILNLALAAAANAVQYFTNGLQVNYAMQVRWSKAIAAMRLTSWIGLITAAAGAVYLLTQRTDTYADTLKKAIKLSEDFDAEVLDEIKELSILFGKIEAVEKGSDEYQEVKDKIISKYGQYLSGLINEKNEIIDLERAYNRLTAAIQRAAQARLLDAMKKNVEDQYVNDLSKFVDKLKNVLLDRGYDLKNVTKVITYVYSKAIKGEKMSMEDLQADLKIDIPDIDKNPFTNFWLEAFGLGDPFRDKVKKGDKAETVGELLEGINEISDSYREAVDAIDNSKKSLKDFNDLDDKSLGMHVQNVRNAIEDHKSKIEMQKAANSSFYKNFNENPISGALRKQAAERSLENNVEVPVYIVNSVGYGYKKQSMSLKEAEAYLERLEVEHAARGGNKTVTMDPIAGNPDFTMDDYEPYVTEKERAKQDREAAAAERRAQIKKKKEFKEDMKRAEANWHEVSTQNLSQYEAGERTYMQYRDDQHKIDINYYEARERVYKKYNLEEDDDYKELIRKKEEFESEWLEKKRAMNVEEANIEQKIEETQLEMDYYSPGSSYYQNEQKKLEKSHEIKVKFLEKIKNFYNKNSEEYHNYMLQLDEIEREEQLRKQKLFAEKVAEWKKAYEYLDANMKYELEITLLNKAWEKKMISDDEKEKITEEIRKKYMSQYLPESAKPTQESEEALKKKMKKDLDIIDSLYEQGLMKEEEYEAAKQRIKDKYAKMPFDKARAAGSSFVNQLLDIYEAWQSFFSKTEDDADNWSIKIGKMASAAFAVISAGLSNLSEYSKLQADIEVAKIEKKYDKELELAEGNSYRTKKLEKQKEKEIAEVKAEIQNRNFGIQVAEAVANTATNAIMAYGSAQSLPYPASQIFGAIAAAMATAQGMAQIAIIKKQQQLAQIQGYSEGGFTRKGGKYEPAGIVHAGEWVASQRLVNHPSTRPVIEALEYAQRTNQIGSIMPEDVTRFVTIPQSYKEQHSIVVEPQDRQTIVYDNPKLMQAIERLNKRLDDPFVTVNTVTGDAGINKAQQRYLRMIKNKSPRYK